MSSPSSRQCPFCSAVFSRVDGARRHAKCCPQRDGRALQAARRGRKTKSCDQCSRVKVHCSSQGQNPCQRCVSRRLECVFSRHCVDAVPRASAHEKLPGSHSYGHQGRASLSFLLNVTDNRRDFITESVVAEEPDGTLVGPVGVTPPQTEAPSNRIFDYIDPTLLLPFDPQESLAPSELGELYTTEEQNLLGAFLSPQSQEDQLSARLNLLELDLDAHARSSDCHRNLFDPVAFRRFFSLSNVHSFAMIFCRKRHYRYPVIHWPTFALETASLPLLLVVSLTGATYSYRPRHGPENITEARKLYHLADSYVSHQLAVFLDHLSCDTNLNEALQLCQAALLMYALDTLLAGDMDMQHTAVTKRLPALISALRKLQFIGCRHDPDEDLQLCLHREHVIRLVTWTFCTDCLATLSYNRPPIFSMLELYGDLPCDPALWDTDPESIFASLTSSRQSTSHSLKDLVSEFLSENWQLCRDWETLPLFDLHAMLCAFHQVTYNLHVTFCLAQKSESLLQGLTAWRHLWARALQKIPKSELRWLGVANHLPDIEHLLRRIIEVSVSSEAASSRYLQRIPSHDSREIHEFIRDFMMKS